PGDAATAAGAARTSAPPRREDSAGGRRYPAGLRGGEPLELTVFDHPSLWKSWPTKRPPITEPSEKRTLILPSPWVAFASTAIRTPPVLSVVLTGSPT